MSEIGCGVCLIKKKCYITNTGKHSHWHSHRIYSYCHQAVRLLALAGLTKLRMLRLF